MSSTSSAGSSYGRRQLAELVECSADRGGFYLGDNEHPARSAGGKRSSGDASEQRHSAASQALHRIRQLHAEGLSSDRISADLGKRGIKLSPVTIRKIASSPVLRVDPWQHS
jgi:hypothetical protein